MKEEAKKNTGNGRRWFYWVSGGTVFNKYNWLFRVKRR